MAALTGRNVRDSYIELLKLNTASTNTGVTGSLIDVTDGGNTASALSISTSQIASTVDGSAGTAAFTRKTDTNTGVFFPAADTIAATTQGTERMRITSTGLVGIGTNSPTAIGSDITLDMRGTATAAIGFGTTALGQFFSMYCVGSNGSFNFINSSATGFTRFYTNATERLRIDSSGNVGIGTVSPTSPLHVYNSANSGKLINIENPNAGTGAYAGFDALSDTVSLSVRPYGSTFNTFTHAGVALAGAAEIWADTISGSGPQALLIGIKTAKPLILATNNTERLRIDSSGNVGIGTTSPSAKLTVDSGSVALGAILNSTNAVGFQFRMDRSGTAFGYMGTPDGVLGGGGTTGLAIRSENILAFGSGGATERMRIDSSGNVGIGMTPTAQLELSTDSAKKPSTNTWTIASDERLKTNITNADNDRCYEIVKQVPLKRYTWKSEVYSQDQVKDRSKLGWIAQDVEAVFPKAVGTNRFVYNQVFEDVVIPELDSDGNAVLDENGVAKTRTEKRLVSEDVIEDCKDLNSDQIYAAMYGTIQKLIEKVETLEAKVLALQVA